MMLWYLLKDCPLHYGILQMVILLQTWVAFSEYHSNHCLISFLMYAKLLWRPLKSVKVSNKRAYNGNKNIIKLLICKNSLIAFSNSGNWGREEVIGEEYCSNGMGKDDGQTDCGECDG
jgi:hypothetical protein